MRMGYGLNVEQTQKLIMTPELRQAITVLQLSALELSMYIEQQLEENPLLELREDEVERGEEAGIGDEQNTAGDEDTDRKEYDLDWEEYFQDSSDLGVVRQERIQEQEDYSYENFLSQSLTLSEHLLFQLNLTPCNDADRLIGEYIIGNLDEHGYLRISLEEVALRLGVSESSVNDMLSVIQGFDPPGVGARNLEECLLIQVKQLGIKDIVLESLIKNYLVDLSKGKLNRIAQELGITVQTDRKSVV